MLTRALTISLMMATGGTARAMNSTDDPTRPPDARPIPQNVTKSQAHKSRHGWWLSSILISAQRRSAIIDNVVVTLGDRIHGARVVAIENDRVRLHGARGYRTLKLRVWNFKSPNTSIQRKHQKP